MEWVKSRWKLLAIALAVAVAAMVLIVILAGGNGGESKDVTEVTTNTEEHKNIQKPADKQNVPVNESVPSNYVPSVKIGDIITFGKYEQDNKEAISYGRFDIPDSEKEPIEWIVLDQQGMKALLISRYALDCQPYEQSRFKEDLSWETSSLRKWLNDTFLNDAFSSDQQAVILTTKVDCNEGESFGWSPVGGNPTEDKVYLLSVKEASQYFADDSARVCWSTLTAWGSGSRWRGYGNRIDNEAGYPSVHWWLRSTSGGDSDTAICGCISENGEYNSSSSVADATENVWVRPVLWVDLTSGQF